MKDPESEPEKDGLPAIAGQPIGRRSWMKGAAALVGTAAAASPMLASATSPGAWGSTRGAPDAVSVRVDTPANAVVQTTAGRVRGFTRNGIFVYKGIPYGDTTAGENRFLAPKKPKPWSDVRPATGWGPVSPHGVRAGWVNPEEQFLYHWDDGFPGEDMLRVNVWSPGVNDNQKRPVLVWIHGGGFTSGSSQELPMYDGESLAKNHDVVLVSMNHRLNVFGYLDLSQIGGEKYADSGNAGMLDLVQALEWVRDNVANFGGDPGNVTIFGQSGGGSKVSTLMAMPAAKGLFHRAAVMSGSSLRQGTPDASARVAGAVLEELGIGRTDLSRLHGIGTDALLNAGIAGPRRLQPTVATPGATTPVAPGAPAPRIGWGPVVDGRVLPQHPFDPGAPAISASVPMLIGTTFHEMSGGMNKPTAHLQSWEQLQAELTPRFGARTPALLAEYQRVLPAAKPFELRAVILSSRQNAVTQAERKAALNAAPAYVYWFGWKTPVLDGRPLAFHCQDLAFWFDNVDLCAQQTGGTEEARVLAKKMSDALVAFARSGNPSHAGIPRWPAYTAANGATMVIDETLVVRNDSDREARRLTQQT
jgi:para-nitrobenzyl esterase